MRSFAVWALLSLSLPLVAELRVENLTDGHLQRHPVAILRGDSTGDFVYVRNAKNRFAYRAPVHDGRYVALVELEPGANQVVLTDRSGMESLTLSYEPMTTDYRVALVYVVGQDEEERYFSPNPDDDFDWESRLQTAGLLMQAFTAEALRLQGFGDKTFGLIEDGNGDPVVHRLVYPMSADELREKDGGELYSMLYSLMEENFDLSRTKAAVIMGFTDYDPETRTVFGHTALGGGSMGLFGGATIWSWPRELQDVPEALLDSTPLDPNTTFDDSGGRSTRWGLAATGIGAWQHELGHAFGLPHTTDPYCIMSRGFDRINRVFTSIEPPTARSDQPTEFARDQRAYWTPFFAARLAANPLFQPDGVPAGEPPRIEYRNGNYVITDDKGVAFWGAQGTVGDVEKPKWEYLRGTAPNEVLVSEADLARHFEDENYDFVLYDVEGNRVQLSSDPIRYDADFLTEWRISAQPRPWPNQPTAPTLQDVNAKIAQLKERPLENYADRRSGAQRSIDFNAVFGYTENRVAYAYRKLQRDAGETVTLVAGNDDGMRVWLNGELVLDASGVRADSAGTHRVPLELVAGNNDLLVEVAQAGGGWGFSVRLEPSV